MGDLELTLIWKFVDIVFVLGLLPAAGGAILWKTLQIAKIPNLNYFQCWKAYLGGCAWALVLFIGVYIALGRPEGLEIVQLSIFFAIPFLVVPLLLRNFSRRALAAEGVALVLIDLAIVLFIVLSQLH